MGEAVITKQNESLETHIISVGDLVLNRLTRQVTRTEKPIQLQAREFQLLEFLLLNEGEVVSREMLLQHVWNYNFDPQTNVVDVHISRLRSKVDKPFHTKLIETVRGAGYRISAPAQR